jgi:hypothetical protein
MWSHASDQRLCDEEARPRCRGKALQGGVREGECACLFVVATLAAWIQVSCCHFEQQQQQHTTTTTNTPAGCKVAEAGASYGQELHH